MNSLTRIQLTAHARRLALTMRSPQAVFRIVLLFLLIGVWLAIGSAMFADHFGDFNWPHIAGRVLLSGGDPYSPAFAARMSGNPQDIVYPYPLASLWLALPLLPLPYPLAATLWVSASLCGMLSLGYLLDMQAPRWAWLLPLLFYPALYALRTTQWAPLQVLLLALSLWLFRRKAPFLSGVALSLVSVKPTTGLGLMLLAGILCATHPRWWQGVLAGSLIWYGVPLFFMPDWPLRWLATLQSFEHTYAVKYFTTLALQPDGALCVAATAVIGLWAIWRRRFVGLGCALLVLSILVTPHRAHYDFPPLFLPFVFLPRRHLWLSVTAVLASWCFPLTFALGWSSSLQITLFMLVPAIVACALVTRRGIL